MNDDLFQMYEKQKEDSLYESMIDLFILDFLNNKPTKEQFLSMIHGVTLTPKILWALWSVKYE